MINFACPQCHKSFQAEDKFAGRKTKCPNCRAAFSIPFTDAAQLSPQPTPKAMPKTPPKSPGSPPKPIPGASTVDPGHGAVGSGEQSGSAHPPSYIAAAEDEGLALGTVTKVVMGVCGAVCIIVVGSVVWLVATRDSWELDNAHRVSAKLAEADQLRQSNPTEAYKIYDESLKEAKQHKIASETFSQTLASAEATRAAIYQRIQDKIREEEGEKRRRADEESRRVAAEAARKRAAVEAEQKRAAAEAERQQAPAKAERERVEEEKRLASIKAHIKGGAWLTKKSGSSESLRGLNIFVIRSCGTKQHFVRMLQTTLRLSEGEVERLKQLKKPHDKEETAGFISKTEQLIDALQKDIRQASRVDTSVPDTKSIFNVLYLFTKLEDEKRRSDEIGRSILPNYRDLWTEYFNSKGSNEEASAFVDICREASVVAAHTDVDGKYSVEVAGGDYYLYAAFDSASSDVEWFVPVKIREAKDVSVDFHNDNATRIRNTFSLPLQ